MAIRRRANGLTSRSLQRRVCSSSGDDKNPTSGRLEFRRHDGGPSHISEGFLMENTEQEGNGPESMLHFIAACRGLPFQNGADQNIGMQAVRVLEAMYRSAASGKTEACL